MTKILIDRETVVQLVRMLSRCLDDAIQVQCDLAQGYSKSLALAQMVQVELSKEALTAGRAALAKAEMVEPTAWVLTEELEKRETTTRAHLWFTNPVNCMWTPIYTGTTSPKEQP